MFQIPQYALTIGIIGSIKNIAIAQRNITNNILPITFISDSFPAYLELLMLAHFFLSIYASSCALSILSIQVGQKS
ncbi:hypothetical protein LCGC14_2202460 [marine sediment metagenome]|uniref:Uncharacterized protein n=1 Tax=marine sediment metagenome TaxID=412755 RepID=A0A0F9DGE1_9ZZZZ